MKESLGNTVISMFPRLSFMELLGQGGLVNIMMILYYYAILWRK
jgi:hypothetical protein